MIGCFCPFFSAGDSPAWMHISSLSNTKEIGVFQFQYLFFCRLSDAGFPVHLLPPTVQAGSKVGVTAEDNLCGLPVGADVYVATGDAQCSVMSTGIRPHQACMCVHWSYTYWKITRNEIESNPV